MKKWIGKPNGTEPEEDGSPEMMQKWLLGDVVVPPDRLGHAKPEVEDGNDWMMKQMVEYLFHCERKLVAKVYATIGTHYGSGSYGDLWRIHARQ